MSNQEFASRCAAFLLMLCSAAPIAVSAADPMDQRKAEERLSFQTGGPWSPRIHLNADVAMVYGIDKGLPARIETWRKRGYRIHVMTGVSWGEYQDYLYGRFDGKNHEDEAQTDKNGQRISHGGDVYYMSPGEAYGRFLTLGVKRAIDAGAEAIHLEEPEFWVRGGYEPNFKREWKAYYGDEWQPLESSPDAQYRASKLKYFLYRRALADVFKFVKDYSRQIGREVRCYVPTHSLLNYAHWRIVSPESSLIDVGCDGYIAQVWTGTSRTPNVYNGIHKERTFETAFLEYGAMQNLVRASGRRVWYLNDPIEDNPNHSWADYRYNWENTLVASLLQPEVWHYEIMPWPDRIFQGKYPKADQGGRRPGGKVEVEPIPPSYEVELQAVIRAMGEMKQPADAVRWEACGTRQVGVIVSDTLMFQRGGPQASDPDLSSFYGLALPLLKRGLVVEPVQLESATAAGFLKPYRLLVLTYEGQKPPRPELHAAIAQWVRAGGALVVVDDDADPYHAVREWWNASPNSYATPRHHLFEALGLKNNQTGLHKVGSGVVLYAAASPAALARKAGGSDTVRQLCRQAADAVGLKWEESDTLVLRRGPYLIAAALDESVPAAQAKVLSGRFISLFDGQLPLLREVKLEPGKRFLLVDLDSFRKEQPRVLAASCRVWQEQATDNTLSFRCDGIAKTEAIIRALLPRAPQAVLINGQELDSKSYTFADGIASIHFPNSVDGIDVVIRY